MMNDNLFIKDRHSFRNQLTIPLGLSIAGHILITAFLLIMGTGHAPPHLAQQLGRVITVSMVSIPHMQSEARGKPSLSGGNKAFPEKREVLSARETTILQDKNKSIVAEMDLSKKQAVVNITSLTPDIHDGKVWKGISTGSNTNNVDGQMTISLPTGSTDKRNSTGDITAPPQSRPRYKANDQPSYPLFARLRGHEGTVLLSVEILSSGRVGKIMVKTSSGYEALDHSALAAVKKWIFEPAMQQGIPVTLLVEIPIRFSLNNIND